MLRDTLPRAAAAMRTDPTVAATISRLTPEFRDQPGPRTVERIILRPATTSTAPSPAAAGAVGTPRPTTPASRRPPDKPQHGCRRSGCA